MTIGFSTKFPDGKPTFFIEKIWTGLIDDANNGSTVDDYDRYFEQYRSKFKRDFENNGTWIHPKIHTLRSDVTDRWKAGMKIHPVINRHKSDRFQFAPTLTCSGTENVKIQWFENSRGSIVKIDNKVLTDLEKLRLAVYDGFESIKQFDSWFDKDWTGKIIHWTPFRYVEDIEIKNPNYGNEWLDDKSNSQ